MSEKFSLHPDIDAGELAARFARDGRVRIHGFLDPACAERMHALLRGREDWKQVINSGDKLVELDRPTRASLSPEQKEALDQAVYGAARSDFQYRYEAIRVPDEAKERKASKDTLARFAEFMSTGSARDLLRTIVGAPAIDFADSQGTAYSPGDFLTGHDDAFPGKNRHAAYVFSLNPVWRLEWGGLLLVHKGADEVEGVVPAFNTLDLFRVGQMHSVSEVTRAAAYRRYAMTGWLRSH